MKKEDSVSEKWKRVTEGSCTHKVKDVKDSENLVQKNSFEVLSAVDSVNTSERVEKLLNKVGKPLLVVSRSNNENTASGDILKTPKISAPTYTTTDYNATKETTLKKLSPAKLQTEEHIEHVRPKNNTSQGFGNVGRHCALSVVAAGAKVIGIQEVDTGLYTEKGIDIEDLLEYLEEHGTIKGYPNAQAAENVAFKDCDILVLAAIEKCITCKNANEIRAKIVAEGANGPVTPAADKILQDRKILVLPDIFCSAGGVTVSYFEFLKNINHVSFGRLHFKYETDSYISLMQSVELSLRKCKIDCEINPTETFRKRLCEPSEKDIVDAGLRYTIERAGVETLRTASELQLCLDLRTAAYCNAIEKIFRTYDNAGLAM
ncbi:glutamate dehydrogenase, mitochondrial-like isoform X1 [Schistocerca nitens]|uniref:glutamate dehydrogenase, mitochondrial-like isoform X1 n=1 Tax=Schistocerca nitens TaxID=7011 RepID=UPI002117D602|nr:glutamate dehydrogenase, mitochondrial-like isoform X1 [Schistocerca nitens]